MRRPAHPLTLSTLLIAGVGGVDAALGGNWDLFVLFGFVVVMQLWVLAKVLSNRVAVSLRPDLARWATQRSQRTGEPVTDVIDRAVALFQDGLYGAAQDDGT